MFKLKRILLILILIGLFTLVILYLLNAFSEKLTVVEYTIESDKIKDEFKFALISDLHSCYYGENQDELLTALDLEKPEFVVFTGDIADDDLPIFNTLKVIDHVGKNYPAYYVTGNHEFKSRYVEYIKDIFRNYKIEVLEGNSKTLKLKDDFIDIAGVDDYIIGEREYNSQLEAVGEGLDFQNYTLLLAHRPEHIEKYKKYKYDLVLSGHAHGGQWRIPNLLNGFFAPNQGFFPKYAGGQYTHGDLVHIVSRGLAKESTRLVPRIFNPPELVIINIKPKSKKKLGEQDGR